MFRESNGYPTCLQRNRNKEIVQCLFLCVCVVDLKYYANNIHDVRNKHALVTTSSKDAELDSDQNKCLCKVRKR